MEKASRALPCEHSYHFSIHHVNTLPTCTGHILPYSAARNAVDAPGEQAIIQVNNSERPIGLDGSQGSNCDIAGRLSSSKRKILQVPTRSVKPSNISPRSKHRVVIVTSQANDQRRTTKRLSTEEVLDIAKRGYIVFRI